MPAFLSKRRGQSAKIFCLLHENPSPHTAAVTTETLKKMHWEVLPHSIYSPDLALSDYHLFGPLENTLGRKNLESTMKLNFFFNDGWTCYQKLIFERA
jgi:hypothetical protein